MEFSRQEYWSGVAFAPPGELPGPGIEPRSPDSPALTGGCFFLFCFVLFLPLPGHDWATKQQGLSQWLKETECVQRSSTRSTDVNCFYSSCQRGLVFNPKDLSSPPIWINVSKPRTQKTPPYTHTHTHTVAFLSQPVCSWKIRGPFSCRSPWHRQTWWYPWKYRISPYCVSALPGASPPRLQTPFHGLSDRFCSLFEQVD